MELLREKFWQIPLADGDINQVTHAKIKQEKFYKEYFPTSHRIFNKEFYEDIPILNSNDEVIDTHMVNRISVPFQSMSIDIILAHLLGNKIYLSDSTLKNNPSLPLYREYWETSNINIAIYDFIKSVLSLGDSAILFFRDTNDGGKLAYQSLSLFNDDEFYMSYDKYRRPQFFYKYYDDKCDVYDDTYVSTYIVNNDEAKLLSALPHGFRGIPVVYKKRAEGAFWTPVQSNIENVEFMLSRLSEDNRAKFKSLYHLSTDNPDEVETSRAGIMDMVITDKDGGFKMIPPAEISSQFKFEYESLKEVIFDKLGIVFPKHKSSGDMPTGSMKMMFYPTERVVMSLINEFDTSIDTINEVVKQGFVTEYPSASKDIYGGNIRASIRLFTPQDEIARNESVATLFDKGIISAETAAEECTVAANNEIDRLKREQAEALELEKQRADTRIPFTL